LKKTEKKGGFMKRKVKKTLITSGVLGLTLLLTFIFSSCPQNPPIDWYEPETADFEFTITNYTTDTITECIIEGDNIENLRVQVNIPPGQTSEMLGPFTLENATWNHNEIRIYVLTNNNSYYDWTEQIFYSYNTFPLSDFMALSYGSPAIDVSDFYISGTNLYGTGYFSYDGTPKTVSITARDNRYSGAITVLYNGVDSAPVNAGEYIVTFNIAAAGELEAVNGLDAGSLFIGKVAGENVNSPTAAVIGMTSITLNTITTNTSQDVEYRYYNNTIYSSSDWQTDPTFTGLTAGTAYTFYARSAGNINYNEGWSSSGTSITTKQQAGVNIISYWADYDGVIGIKRQDNEPITNNTITVAPGETIAFTPNTSGYSNHKWTLNGVSVGTGLEYIFDTNGMEADKNYIIGLYVEKGGKPYFSQITVMIRSALTGTVTITGTAVIGQTLTANTNNLGGSGTISYQWNRSGVVINGANNSTYIVQSEDVGHFFTVTVRRSGNSGSRTSAQTATVLPQLTGFVSINGNAQVGQTLSVNTNNLGGSGTITYQWRRGGTSGSIVGNNSTSYTVQTADVGFNITVIVTYSGNSGSVSASVGPVTPRPVSVEDFAGYWYGGIKSYSFNGNNFEHGYDLSTRLRGTFTVTATHITFNITHIMYMNSGNWQSFYGSDIYFDDRPVSYRFNSSGSTTPLTINNVNLYRSN